MPLCTGRGAIAGRIVRRQPSLDDDNVTTVDLGSRSDNQDFITAEGDKRIGPDIRDGQIREIVETANVFEV